MRSQARVRRARPHRTMYAEPHVRSSRSTRSAGQSGNLATRRAANADGRVAMTGVVVWSGWVGRCESSEIFANAT
jgi:hypothetical protein